MGEGHKKLNFSDCMGLAIGQIIGSGIMVLTGIVIGLTGHGIAAAFILGAVLAIITCVPFIILTSAIPSSGAGFTYIRRLMGEKAGFMYIAMFVLSQVLIATYAKGFASYFCSIFPQFGESAVAMAALVICTAVNLIGLKSSALVQKGMVVLLLLSLFLFIVFGLPKVSWDALTPTVSNLMPNGPKNFFTGVALLSFACGGAKFVAENGDDIVEAIGGNSIHRRRKNLPDAASLQNFHGRVQVKSLFAVRMQSKIVAYISLCLLSQTGRNSLLQRGFGQLAFLSGLIHQFSAYLCRKRFSVCADIA